MILEKPISLVLALRFLCALCSNDAPTSRGTTIAMSTGLDYESGSTENLGIYDPRSTENNVEITSHGAITTFYHESTVEPLMTVFQLVTDNDKSSSPTTVDQTTRLVTMPDDVIFTTNTTCDPTWPVNASGN